MSEPHYSVLRKKLDIDTGGGERFRSFPEEKYVILFMKPLFLVFSDQPYLPGQLKKRTKFTEPPLYKKAKKEAKQNQLPLQPVTLTKPHSLKTTEFPSLPEEVLLKDQHEPETPSKDPVTDPSSKTPESVRKSFKRLF